MMHFRSFCDQYIDSFYINVQIREVCVCTDIHVCVYVDLYRHSKTKLQIYDRIHFLYFFLNLFMQLFSSNEDVIFEDLMYLFPSGTILSTILRLLSIN